MRRYRPFQLSLALLWLFVACGPGLPSETALGRGPLAEDEDAGARKLAKNDDDGGAPVASASAVPAPSTPPLPPSGHTLDAGGDAAQSSDAGAKSSDAGSTSATAQLQVDGDYRGSDVTKIFLPGVPDQVENDDKARTVVKRVSGDNITFTAVSSADGSDICTLKAKLKGKTASIAPGQNCFSAPDGNSLVGTVKSGSGIFDGKKLTLDMELDLEMNAGGQSVKGRLSYHFEGNRP